ncbi:MAG: copper chaperone PCu(A)C [Candidatus Sericytochromatia bacterium]|nr:copper chaperone PCu(A)C [Candidatus Sericytochromatia bacterium]
MKLFALAAAVLASLAVVPPTAAEACSGGGCVVDKKIEGLHVCEPWVREAPPGASAMAAYMKIKNGGKAELKVTGAQSPQFKSVEIHEIVNADGMARMQEVKQLVVPAAGAVALEPGATHVMLIGPKKALAAGARVDLTLMLSNGKKLAIPMAVRPRGAQAAPAHEHHHDEHQHGGH